MPPLELLLARVRGEYREMPGLRLTFAQASRLWQMDAATTELVMHTLLEQNVLARTRDGAFILAPDARVNRVSLPATLTSGRSARSRLRRPA